MATYPAGSRTAPVTTGFGALSSSVKFSIAAILVAVVVGGYYWLLHLPLMARIAQTEAESQTLTTQLAEAEAKLRDFVRLRETLAAREGVDRANLRALPESAEMASFLQELNRLGAASGLELRQVTPFPEESDQPHYIRVPVELELAGEYHQVARFFYNVSRLERAISMERILLERASENEPNNRLHVKVRAITFRRPTQEEAAAVQGGAS